MPEQAPLQQRSPELQRRITNCEVNARTGLGLAGLIFGGTLLGAFIFLPLVSIPPIFIVSALVGSGVLAYASKLHGDMATALKAGTFEGKRENKDLDANEIDGTLTLEANNAQEQTAHRADLQKPFDRTRLDSMTFRTTGKTLANSFDVREAALLELALGPTVKSALQDQLAERLNDGVSSETRVPFVKAIVDDLVADRQIAEVELVWPSADRNGLTLMLTPLGEQTVLALGSRDAFANGFADLP